MFVTYDVCHIMIIVGYDDCRIMTLVGYDIGRIMKFVAYEVFKCVVYRICHNANQIAVWRYSFSDCIWIHEIAN